MTDKILDVINRETSSACLMSLRRWAIREKRWLDDPHEQAYKQKREEIESKWQK